MICMEYATVRLRLPWMRGKWKILVPSPLSKWRGYPYYSALQDRFSFLFTLLVSWLLGFEIAHKKIQLHLVRFSSCFSSCIRQRLRLSFLSAQSRQPAHKAPRSSRHALQRVAKKPAGCQAALSRTRAATARMQYSSVRWKAAREAIAALRTNKPLSGYQPGSARASAASLRSTRLSTHPPRRRLSNPKPAPPLPRLPTHLPLSSTGSLPFSHSSPNAAKHVPNKPPKRRDAFFRTRAAFAPTNNS